MHHEVLAVFDLHSWDMPPTANIQQQAISALENGKVVYFNALPFKLEAHEIQFLTPAISNGNAKNVSYNISTDVMGGANCQGYSQAQLKGLIKRYAQYSTSLINNLFPQYANKIKVGRTSYRPVEIAGRKAPSYRKDDTLLHIDAFPASPTQGSRILRVFTNVNPHGQPRVWRVGEPLAQVISKFAPQVKPQFPGSAWLQKLLKITKGYRSSYDHYMLNIHNTMKRDQDYQRNVMQKEIKFPPESTWIVYTDQVSHAAMAGQYVFEQTFYVPVEALHDQCTAPLMALQSKYL